MSNYISINIQQVTSPATTICHNKLDRENIPYLLTSPHTVSKYRYDLENVENYSKKDVYDYFKLRQVEINQDYKNHSNNRNLKKDTKLYQEGVISFGREQFEQCTQSEILEYITKFCNDFEKTYGANVIMSSLHLDEGHKDEEEKLLHNYHAHILIENYSFETHKTCLQKLDYRKLQTQLAENFKPLGFVRGEENSKAVRLEHKEYRAQKEKEKGLVKKELNKKMETLQSEMQPLVDLVVELNPDFETYEVISAPDITTSITEALNKKDAIIADYEDKIKTILNPKELELFHKQTREQLIQTQRAKQEDYTHLKKLLNAYREDIAKNIKDLKTKSQYAGAETYQKRLQEKNPILSKTLKTPLLVAIAELETTSAREVINNVNELIKTAEKIREIEAPIFKEKIIEIEKTIYVDKEVEREKIIEIPEYVEKIEEVTKHVEKPVINDIDVNEQQAQKIKELTEDNGELTKKNADLNTRIETLNTSISTLEQENNDLKTLITNFLERPLIKKLVKPLTATLSAFDALVERFKGVSVAIEYDIEEKTAKKVAGSPIPPIFSSPINENDLNRNNFLVVIDTQAREKYFIPNDKEAVLEFYRQNAPEITAKFERDGELKAKEKWLQLKPATVGQIMSIMETATEARLVGRTPGSIVRVGKNRAEVEAKDFEPKRDYNENPIEEYIQTPVEHSKRRGYSR